MNKKILETLEFDKVKALFEPHLLTEQGLEQLRQLSPTAKADKIKQAFAEMKEMRFFSSSNRILLFSQLRKLQESARGWRWERISISRSSYS